MNTTEDQRQKGCHWLVRIPRPDGSGDEEHSFYSASNAGAFLDLMEQRGVRGWLDNLDLRAEAPTCCPICDRLNIDLVKGSAFPGRF